MDEHDRTSDKPEAAGAPVTGAGRVTLGRFTIVPSHRIFRDKAITLELPSEITSILGQLMNQTNRDPEELFIRSLLLYKVAVDAQEAGKTIAILDAEGDIDQEIKGL